MNAVKADRSVAHPTSPIVAMCVGSSCRKRPEHEELRSRLADTTHLRRISCVGVCSGPVVAVVPDNGAPIMIRKVRSPKARRDLARLVRGRKLSDRLRRRLVTGANAAKAVRRTARAAG